MRVPPDYEQAFQRAELTFRHQRVYDMDTCALTTLTPVPEGMDADKMDFIGPYVLIFFMEVWRALLLVI